MFSNKHQSSEDISDGYCQCAVCVNKSASFFNQEVI